MKVYPVIKRLVDFVFALIFLVIALPVMVMAALAIKIESKGPIFFKQKRVGKYTRIFTIFKFRTMSIEVEKDGRPLKDNERITKVGSFLRKSSIDELPQLFNILMGEMSFIGPRPLLVQYLEHYSNEQMRRHVVTPGISGWAQVNGRNAISWEQKFILDVWYVDHMNPIIDITILWLTILKVIKRNDLNHTPSDTMPYFVKMPGKVQNKH